MAKDFYTVLGVSRTASQKEIREAFRKLARQYHPDVNPGNADAEERFKEISAANEVLSDEESRTAYDKYGENWRNADQIEEAMRQRGPGGDCTARRQDAGRHSTRWRQRWDQYGRALRR